MGRVYDCKTDEERELGVFYDDSAERKLTVRQLK